MPEHATEPLRITDSRAFQDPQGPVEAPLVVLGDRQTGKTARLLSWLLGGHRLDAWPSWSRVLIVTDLHDARQLARDNTELSLALRGLGGPELAKVILAAGDYAVTRLTIRHDVEVAIDDVQHYLYLHIGLRPAVVALNGESYDRRTNTTPFIDGRGVQHLWYALEGRWGHVGRLKQQCEDVLCLDFEGEVPKP